MQTQMLLMRDRARERELPVGCREVDDGRLVVGRWCTCGCIYLDRLNEEESGSMQVE